MTVKLYYTVLWVYREEFLEAKYSFFHCLGTAAQEEDESKNNNVYIIIVIIKNIYKSDNDVAVYNLYTHYMYTNIQGEPLCLPNEFDYITIYYFVYFFKFDYKYFDCP